MRRQLLVLTLWVRVAITVAVWLLVFVPSRGTVLVVSGAALSYSAARRGYRLGRRILRLPGHATADPLSTGWHDIPQPGEPHAAFAAGYDLYSPSEKRWIIGGAELSYPTGDALFDYLHTSLAQQSDARSVGVERAGRGADASRAPK